MQQYNRQQILNVVNHQLLLWIKKDETVKNAVFELIQTKHPTKKETDDKFEKMLLRMDEDRIRQDKKWADDKAADDKKWAEQKAAEDKKWAEDKAADEKKWAENQKIINATLEEIKTCNKKIDQSIGALGARWGLNSEASFRNALKGILRELDSQYEVIRYEEIDEEGIVFDRPGPIEIDIIIKNGKIYLIEIKSSISKADIHVFLRKVKYYEKRHKKKVYQSIVISPMIDERAKEFAHGEKVKLYSYANDVSL